MTQQSPLVDPVVAAAAIELLRLATDPIATKARLGELSAASAEARDLIDKAVAEQAALVTAQAEHKIKLDAISCQHKAEVEARRAELGKEIAAADVANARAKENVELREAQLEVHRQRVARLGADCEAKASYLTARIAELEQRGAPAGNPPRS